LILGVNNGCACSVQDLLYYKEQCSESFVLAENKRTEERPSETPIKIWLFNEKEAIERVLKESGEDMFQQEVDYFVQRIIDDKTHIYSRRSDIKGVGMVYAEGIKFADLLSEAIHAYMLGMYNSAIALSCMAAERLCYDFIDISNITLNSKQLNDKQRPTYIRSHLPGW